MTKVHGLIITLSCAAILGAGFFLFENGSIVETEPAVNKSSESTATDARIYSEAESVSDDSITLGAEVDTDRISVSNPSPSSSPDNIKDVSANDVAPDAIEREEIVRIWDDLHVPPDPTDFNHDAYYSGPFEDEVRLADAEEECIEDCAEALTELMESDGDQADQVNQGDLSADARKLDWTDEFPAIPLDDPYPLDGPPTE